MHPGCARRPRGQGSSAQAATRRHHIEDALVVQGGEGCAIHEAAGEERQHKLRVEIPPAGGSKRRRYALAGRPIGHGAKIGERPFIPCRCRTSSQARKKASASASITATRSFLPLPLRTRTVPTRSSTGRSASASLIRNPERHNRAIRARLRTALSVPREALSSARISSPVSGSGGNRLPFAGAPRDS
jgi:hypothetical protein